MIKITIPTKYRPEYGEDLVIELDPKSSYIAMLDQLTRKIYQSAYKVGKPEAASQFYAVKILLLIKGITDAVFDAILLQNVPDSTQTERQVSLPYDFDKIVIQHQEGEKVPRFIDLYDAFVAKLSKHEKINVLTECFVLPTFLDGTSSILPNRNSKVYNYEMYRIVAEIWNEIIGTYYPQLKQ